MSAARTVAAFAVAIGLAGPVAAQQPARGEAVFNDRCAACHTSNDPRTPTVAALRQKSPDDILNALTSGLMRQQGSEMSEAERRIVAEYLGGRAVGSASVPTGDAGMCAAGSSAAFDAAAVAQQPSWKAWGPDLTNTRYQSAAGAGLTAQTVPKLTLKWAFGFPNATSARGQPTIAGGRVFVAGQDATIYSLDAKRGCIVWTFKAKANVRSAIVIATGVGSVPVTAYFGDNRSEVYALNAITGALLWSARVDDHPNGHIVGAPALYQNRLYVSIASGEEGQGNNARYECCTFRGSVVALNAVNGSQIWKTFTIPQEPKTLGRNSGGSVRWGPSGAGVWASPTVDPKRRLVYAATGNMYTEPQQSTSDAIVAFDLDSGKMMWHTQLTPKDVFVVGCNQPNPANCPAGDDVGPDFDFGNTPMLTTTANGRDLIVIGQKSGVGWALDPDKNGAIVWEYRAGQGSALGGMEFGSATDGKNAYFPVADGNMPTAGEMHAVDLATGNRAWRTVAPPVLCGQRGRGCTPAILGAITVIPGVIFAGAMDGGLRAYDSNTGAIIWQYDTNKDFTTVNGVPAKGASINGPGPTVAGGMVIVNSGYGALGGRPGNVLLAFGVE